MDRRIVIKMGGQTDRNRRTDWQAVIQRNRRTNILIFRQTNRAIEGLMDKRTSRQIFEYFAIVFLIASFVRAIISTCCCTPTSLQDLDGIEKTNNRTPPRAETINLFTATVIMKLKWSYLFVTATNFHPSLMFANKVRAYTSGASIIQKCKTRVEVADIKYSLAYWTIVFIQS